MEILTLNKTQKKKLLELCERFFPEFKTIKVDFFGEWEGIVSFCADAKLTNDSVQHLIHWYHLCLTELPKKIARKAQALATETIRERALRAKHPVDYLYMLAKLIKQ